MTEQERNEREAHKEKGNFGQDEAKQEERRDSELKHMGELSKKKNK